MTQGCMTINRERKYDCLLFLQKKTQIANAQITICEYSQTIVTHWIDCDNAREMNKISSQIRGK